jgi:hypothetical protein
MTAPCGVVDATGPCRSPAVPEAPLNLCAHHLLLAHDWVDGDLGVTDLLPSPCVACGSRLGVHYPSGWMCAICEWRYGEVPDRELPFARVDVVYYIRYRGQVKIGTSGNPRQRLASLPHEEVLAFERGGRAVEQRRHAQFADLRHGSSEWFEVHDSLLEHVARLGHGVDDPWARYNLWVSQMLALRG